MRSECRERSGRRERGSPRAKGKEDRFQRGTGLRYRQPARERKGVKIKMATCQFCKRSDFKSQSAVIGHLRACEVYKRRSHEQQQPKLSSLKAAAAGQKSAELSGKLSGIENATKEIGAVRTLRRMEEEESRPGMLASQISNAQIALGESLTAWEVDAVEICQAQDELEYLVRKEADTFRELSPDTVRSLCLRVKHKIFDGIVGEKKKRFSSLANGGAKTLLERAYAISILKRNGCSF